MYGVEAAGRGIDTPEHAASLNRGRPGVLHGNRTYLLQDADGQIQEAHSLSAGLDYGNVAINNVDAGIMNAPYGGRKQSGVGYEHGREGLLEYFNFKHVRLHHGVGA